MVCPKHAPVQWWLEAPNLPRDLAFFSAPFPTDGRAIALLKTLYRGVPVVFVGDMDPYAIVQYEEARRKIARSATLIHGGVNSGWLDAIDKASKNRRALARIRISLDKHEVDLLKALERSVDLEALIGLRGAQMLREGFKVELEGATNPAFHRPGHGRWVFGYLRSRAAS